MPTTLLATNWSAVGGTLLVMVLGSFAALWAQGAPVNRGMRSALYVTIGFVGSLILLVGLIGFLIPELFNPIGPVIAGLAIVLPLWKPFRVVVARIAPIDPGSATHAVALVVVLVTVLLKIAVLLAAAGRNEPIVLATSPVELFVQNLSLVVLSFFAVGLWLRRDLPTTLVRLGLVQPTTRQIGESLLVAAALTAVTAVVWPLTPDVPPGGDLVSDAVLAQLVSPVAALVVAVSTAVAMEIAFRGALQPRLGLPLTALTYLLVHAQYPLTPSLLALALAAVGLGLLRQRASTTACILAHAAYLIALVVLALVMRGAL